MTRNYSNADEVLDSIWTVVEFGSFQERPKVDSIGIFGSQPLKIEYLTRRRPRAMVPAWGPIAPPRDIS